MYHFFVGQDQIQKEHISVTGPDVNHIKNVLRMRTGEQVLIGNRVDRDYLCELSEIAADQILFRILGEREETAELPAKLVLYQGLPKGDKMELIIQKAVELGADRIVPVATHRTVVKLDAKKEQVRVKRWNAISESAAKQSKRMLIPEVTRVLTLKEALEEAGDFDLKLIPYECAEGMAKTRAVLQQAAPGMKIAVFIGPEGGFEEAEITLAEQYGVEPITLGRRILRTETAGLCVLSALMLALDH